MISEVSKMRQMSQMSLFFEPNGEPFSLIYEDKNLTMFESNNTKH